MATQEYDWEDKTIGIINARLGIEEEMDDDGESEIEGEQNDNNKDDGGKTGETSKRQVEKWWEGLSMNLRRMMMMTTKGTKNVVPIGK